MPSQRGAGASVRLAAGRAGKEQEDEEKVAIQADPRYDHRAVLKAVTTLRTSAAQAALLEAAGESAAAALDAAARVPPKFQAVGVLEWNGFGISRGMKLTAMPEGLALEPMPAPGSDGDGDGGGLDGGDVGAHDGDGSRGKPGAGDESPERSMASLAAREQARKAKAQAAARLAAITGPVGTPFGASAAVQASPAATRILGPTALAPQITAAPKLSAMKAHSAAASGGAGLPEVSVSGGGEGVGAGAGAQVIASSAARIAMAPRRSRKTVPDYFESVHPTTATPPPATPGPSPLRSPLSAAGEAAIGRRSPSKGLRSPTSPLAKTEAASATGLHAEVVPGQALGELARAMEALSSSAFGSPMPMVQTRVLRSVKITKPGILHKL